MSHFPAKSIRDSCFTHSCCQKESIEKKNRYRNNINANRVKRAWSSLHTMLISVTPIKTDL